MNKWLLRAALVVGILSPLPAPAQSVVQNTLTGNETWNVGQGPGGPGGFITSNLVRNSFNHALNAVTASVALGTGATASLATGGLLLVTAQPSAATITLPPNPVPDGAIIGYCNVTGSNFATAAVTMAAATGQTLSTAVTLTTQTAGTCAYVTFHRATTTWYRIN